MASEDLLSRFRYFVCVSRTVVFGLFPHPFYVDSYHMMYYDILIRLSK